MHAFFFSPLLEGIPARIEGDWRGEKTSSKRKWHCIAGVRRQGHPPDFFSSHYMDRKSKADHQAFIAIRRNVGIHLIGPIQIVPRSGMRSPVF
jgi:hypothetical protein